MEHEIQPRLNTLTIIADQQQEQWRKVESDHDLTPDQRNEHDVELNRAIWMVQGLTVDRSVVHSEIDVTEHDGKFRRRVYEPIELDEVPFRNGVGTAYVQFTECTFYNTGHSIYTMRLGVPYPGVELVDPASAWLDNENSAEWLILSARTDEQPLKSTLQNVLDFNSFIENEVAAKAGIIV